MVKTNFGLVEWSKKAYNEKWGYVWGTFGQTLTNSLLNQKIKQYPNGVGKYTSYIRNNYMGKKVTDCVGLIKGYYWSEGSKIKYNSATDVNANMMYNKATKKGKIGSIPDIPGLCVWSRGHIGVYIGNGYVIEAQGTKYGVRKYKLKDRNFTHWLECPYIQYIDEPIKELDHTPSVWAKDSVKWAKANNISDGTRPKDNATREEVLTMLYRLKKGDM